MKTKNKTQKSKPKTLTELKATIIHNSQLKEQLDKAQVYLHHLDKRSDRQSKRIEENSIEIVQLKEQNSNLIEAISVLGRNIRLQNQGERFKEESNSYQVTTEKPKENKCSIQKEDKNL